MLTLKQEFYSKFSIKIEKSHFDKFLKHVLQYEMRNDNPEVFNGSYMGVKKVFFFEKDVHFLFDLFDIEIREVKKAIKANPNVDNNWKVASDPYNVFTIYIAHLVNASSLPRVMKEDFQIMLFKMLQYKFFTSLVNHNFPKGANEDVMRHTVENLTMQFGIKKHESWKKLFEAKAKKVIFPPVDEKKRRKAKLIHADVIHSFSPDKGIVDVINNIQTTVRSVVNIIKNIYYENHEKGVKIAAVGLVDEIEGEKVFKSSVASYEVMVAQTAATFNNANKVIDNDYVDYVHKLVGNFKPDQFRPLLMKFSNICIEQDRKKISMKVVGKNENEIIIGYKALVDRVVQTTYREVLKDKNVDVKSKLAILNKASQIYRSSRIDNQDVAIIKQSVGKFVESYSGSKREATLTSMKIAFILYTVLISMKSL